MRPAFSHLYLWHVVGVVGFQRIIFKFQKSCACFDLVAHKHVTKVWECHYCLKPTMRWKRLPVLQCQHLLSWFLSSLAMCSISILGSIININKGGGEEVSSLTNCGLHIPNEMDYNAYPNQCMLLFGVMHCNNIFTPEFNLYQQKFNRLCGRYRT